MILLGGLSEKKKPCKQGFRFSTGSRLCGIYKPLKYFIGHTFLNGVVVPLFVGQKMPLLPG
jgi:hypothetical protein